jgi:hypothetical protein
MAVGGDYAHAEGKGGFAFVADGVDGWRKLPVEVPYLSGLTEVAPGYDTLAVGPAGCFSLSTAPPKAEDQKCGIPLNAVSRGALKARVWAVGPKGVVLTRKMERKKGALE